MNIKPSNKSTEPALSSWRNNLLSTEPAFSSWRNNLFSVGEIIYFLLVRPWYHLKNLLKSKENAVEVMSSIEDIRPILLIARAFGLAPYSLTENSISSSKLAKFYCLPHLLFHVHTIYHRVIYFCSDAEFQYRMLGFLRLLLLSLSYVSDVAISMAKVDKLQSALNHLREYDEATKVILAKRLYDLSMHTNIRK